MSRPNRSPIPLEDLRKLAEQGKTDAEIGRLYGCSAQAICSRRFRHGIPAGRQLPASTEADIARIAQLAAEGWSDRRIGEEFGCSGTIIGDRRKAAGIEPGCPGSRNSRSAAKAAYAPPKATYATITEADAAFDRMIGERRFEDVRAKPAERFVPVSRPNSHGASLTGCAAALACV